MKITKDTFKNLKFNIHIDISELEPEQECECIKCDYERAMFATYLMEKD